MEQPGQEFLTIKQFAKKMGMHENTIRKNIKNGRINAVRIGPSEKSSYRISVHEIQRLAYDHLEKIIEIKIKTLLSS